MTLRILGNIKIKQYAKRIWDVILVKSYRGTTRKLTSYMT